METFSILAVSAISIGCVYGLVGMSLAVIYNVSNVINFAQGEFVMVGAVVAYALTGPLGMGYVPTVVVAAVSVGALGYIVVKLAVGPHLARGTAEFPMIIVLMGVSIGISQIVLLITGPVGHSVPYAFGPQTITILGIPIQPHNFLIIGMTILVAIGYWFLMKHTMLGMATRAVGFNRDMAHLTGISVMRIVVFVFVLSGLISGMTGALVAPLIGAQPLMGLDLVFKGFMALVLGGGFSNPYGALLGGITISVLSTTLVGFGYGSISEVSIFLAMLAVIVWRPTGLMGEVKVS